MTNRPKATLMKCSRCNKQMNPTGSWENTWPLHGKITIGFSSQIFAFLGGAENIATPEHFKQWQKGHPAITKHEAQEAVFEWRHDSENYRLCDDCQKEFLQTIGKFFGIGKSDNYENKINPNPNHRNTL